MSASPNPPPALSGIGAAVRAARERRGWSRETLAHHAGLSWSAITQIESGRRTDIRLSTLFALARALGVSIDHLSDPVGASPLAMLEHQALIYDSDAELVTGMVPFIAGGAERGEAVLVVTMPARIGLLQDALGDAASEVTFVSSRDWYTSPAEALQRHRRFVEDHVRSGSAWIRIVAEPVWDGRSAAEIGAWARYEAMINLSLATTPATIVCPYDAGALSPAIVQNAERTHPHLRGHEGPVACTSYEDPERLLLEHAQA
jgi:transcriptional regulator with XRE-family HTH domain